VDIAHGVNIVNVVGQLIIPAIVVKKTTKYYSLIDLTNSLYVLLTKIEEMYEQQLQEKSTSHIQDTYIPSCFNYLFVAKLHLLN
jgi:hypothetical protein